MAKTLVLVLIILVVGFLVVWALLRMHKEATLLDDEEHQERKAQERALREAQDDLRYETEQAERFAGLNKKGKKK